MCTAKALYFMRDHGKMRYACADPAHAAMSDGCTWADMMSLDGVAHEIERNAARLWRESLKIKL